MVGQTVKQKIDKDEEKSYKRAMLEFGDGKVGRDIYHMIKSRYRIIYIRSHEEKRVIDYFVNMSFADGYSLNQWDCSRGLLDSHSHQPVTHENSELQEGDPVAILAYIVDKAKEHNNKMAEQNKNKRTASSDAHIYMLLDFHPFLEGMPQIERKFKEFEQLTSLITIVIIAPVFVCPQSLEKEFTLIDFPYPSDKEIEKSLDKIVSIVPKDFPEAIKTAKKHREELVKSARGLTLREVENAYAKTLIKHKTFHIPTILEEKKQMIRKGSILEYRDSRFRFDDIGGLDVLKEWLQTRRLAFRDDAVEFGLETPKGVLFCGPPGCGKSMICDALASCYEMPLLRLDMGAIFGSLVGESESNIRKCLQIVESVAPCILWVDEVEKGIGNIQSSGDSGTTQRVFGTFLTWLQDKQSPVFVACTANNVNGLPPEFLRAGRFDEIFFLDLPNYDQRFEVIGKLLQRKKREPKDFNIDDIAECTENYTPVEIEKGINNALFVAYSDNKRKITTEDIVGEIHKFSPLYNTKHEEIQKMREWALGDKTCSGGRAIMASSIKNKTTVSPSPVLELDLSST